MVGVKGPKVVISQDLLTGHCLFLEACYSLGLGDPTAPELLLSLHSLFLSLLFWVLSLHPAWELLETWWQCNKIGSALSTPTCVLALGHDRRLKAK